LSRLLQTVTVLFLLAVAGGAPAQDDPPGDAVNRAAVAEVVADESLTLSTAEWLIVAVCLVISVLAGGFTLLCYLRRRDTLSMIDSLESRYPAKSDFS
jgi:hypothetical protein